MSQDRRKELLDRVFAQGARSRPASGGALAPGVLAQIIEGLVFAQRPIRAAGAAVTARHDLGPRGSFILSLVANGVEYPNDLAVVLRIGRSLVTAELTRLQDAGLVTSTAGEDRRRSRLSLTPEGAAANEEVRAALLDSIARTFAGYSAEDVALFAEMLGKVQDIPD